MRTTLALMTVALIGFACLATGSVTWAQGSGFVCGNYRQKCAPQLNGCTQYPSSCPSGSTNCAKSNQPASRGDCFSSSGTCNNANFDCIVWKYYNNPSCNCTTNLLCTVTTQLSGC